MIRTTFFAKLTLIYPPRVPLKIIPYLKVDSTHYKTRKNMILEAP